MILAKFFAREWDHQKYVDVVGGGLWDCASFGSACMGHSEVHVLVDQVGYETGASKQALVAGTEQDHPREFALVDVATGKQVFSGELRPAGKVYAWTPANGDTYWLAEFSAWQDAGSV